MRVKFTACEPTGGQYRDLVAVGWRHCFSIGRVDDAIHQTCDGIHSCSALEVGQEIVLDFSSLLFQVFSSHNLQKAGLFLANSMAESKLNVNQVFAVQSARRAPPAFLTYPMACGGVPIETTHPEG